MESVTACSIMDLMTATRAGCGDDFGWAGLTHPGEEDEFADLLREFVMFGLVAKRTRHATASRGNRPHVVTGESFQNPNGRHEGGQGFLLAMAVEVDCRRLFFK